MKNFLALSAFFLLFFASAYRATAQIVNIPDGKFKNRLVNLPCVDTDGDGYGNIDADTNDDGEIQVDEALTVTSLHVSNSSIWSLDGIQAFSNLDTLDCEGNILSSLNLQGLTNLEWLQCSDNPLMTLDAHDWTNLKNLYCYGNNLTSLDVHGLTNLEWLICPFNQLTSLDLQGLDNLRFLNIGNNQLTSLDVQAMTNLENLHCGSNQLTSLNVQGLANLEEFYCFENYLTSLGLQGLTNLERLECNINQLTSLDLQGLINLDTLNCGLNQLTTLDLQGLTNLKKLDLGQNQLTALDLQGLTNLATLFCYKNNLTSLDLQGLTNLKYLYCEDNQLTALDLQGLTNLKGLICSNTQLTALDLQGLTNLATLYCYKNNLTSLDLQGLTNLKYLYCEDNQLTSLNLQGLTNLKYLDCSRNQLTSLNLQDLTSLLRLYCYNNQLTSLFLKNGGSTTSLYFPNNPNLAYICCDDFELQYVQNEANSSGLTNCAINSYCSFTPGGVFYTIKGENKIDLNSNGCDASDLSYPHLKYTIVDSVNNGVFISDASGNYHIPVQAGIHTVTPVLENPDYFTVSPPSVQVDFPAAGDTLVQNFCITPNGVHNDLEVSILAVVPARPGFDATYKIIYKNKGNTTLTGSVRLEYSDDLMDLVGATPAANSQSTGLLVWAFADLQPFQSVSMLVTMNINSPMEVPAVNVDDYLSFTAKVLPIDNDETAGDNTFELRQQVVGSFDPNDKTCLEGNAITPEMVGKYVHYLIRFENTGTYAAENIVVKDVINASTFEVASLQVTDASHAVSTRITGGNKVEFIFENIQLPFDDANNDGYIAFKIKTLPNLVLGDTLSNQADIFFDYNLPITTNLAETTVSPTIATHETLLSNYALALLPNPATDLVQLRTDAHLVRAEVYDAVGRLVLQSGLSSGQIRVGTLPKGSYAVKVYCEEGVLVGKLVRE